MRNTFTVVTRAPAAFVAGKGMYRSAPLFVMLALMAHEMIMFRSNYRTVVNTDFPLLLSTLTYPITRTDNHTEAAPRLAARPCQKSFDIILESIQRRHSVYVNEQNAPHRADRVQARSFPRKSFPCLPSELNWKRRQILRRGAHEGFFYVKTFKTASTTVMGVTIRMALKSAQRHGMTNHRPCKTRFEHWPAHLLDYQNRTRDKSFLFAVLRDPTMRAISMFFHFEVSRNKIEPTDAAFKKYLTSLPSASRWKTYYPHGWVYDHYLHFLSLDGYSLGSETDSTQLRIQAANKILTDYDFIGITERLDESLVAMQMILGLETTDILYTSAKGRGTWDDQGYYIQPSFVSPGMEKFFASDTWLELSKGDYLLYLAANASLDRTIDFLGREHFDHKLALFRYALDLAASKCSHIGAMYSAAGFKNLTDCLYEDAGCGNECFDQLFLG